MKLQRVTAVSLLGLSVWAGAVPVKVVDDKTGVTRITDKATGETVYMTGTVLRYSGQGRHWVVKLGTDKTKYCGFSSSLITNSAIFISEQCIYGHAEMLKYSKLGKLKWDNKMDSYRIEFLSYWPINHLINYSETYDGATLTYNNRIVDEVNAIVSAKDGILLGETKGLLLIDTTEYENPTDTMWKWKTSAKLIKSVPYSVYTLFGKLIHDSFDTPFRKGCTDYNPNIYMLSSENGIIQPEYAKNIVKGDYIYAHRADQCGKFTYKFHWTDPRNPAPQVLQGWR